MTEAAAKPMPNFTTDWINSTPLLNGLTQDEACLPLGINIIIIFMVRYASLLILTDYIIMKRVVLILCACLYKYMCMSLNVYARGGCIHMCVYIMCVYIDIHTHTFHIPICSVFTIWMETIFFKNKNHIKGNPYQFISRGRNSE